MDLRSISTFIQVAESGSFSRAAEKLGYSQPTISVHIRQLEESLGIKLFDRIGHAVRLTEKGRDILPHAQQVYRMALQLQQSAGQKSTVRGTIRVATAESLCVPLMERGFSHLRKDYPDIHLELFTAGTAMLFQMLDHNDTDIVCTLDSRLYNTRYITAGEEKIGVHFVVSAASPLARTDKLTRQDLMEQDLLLTEKGMSYRRQLDEWLAKDGLEVQPVLENGNAGLLCQLVEQGLGVSFLPDYVTEEAVHRGSVIRLDAEGFQPELWKQLLYRRDKWISEPMAVVLEELAAIRIQAADNRVL